MAHKHDKGLPMMKDGEGRIQPKRKPMGIHKHDDEGYTDLKAKGLGRLSSVASKASKAGEMSPTKSKNGY